MYVVYIPNSINMEHAGDTNGPKTGCKKELPGIFGRMGLNIQGALVCPSLMGKSGELLQGYHIIVDRRKFGS